MARPLTCVSEISDFRCHCRSFKKCHFLSRGSRLVISIVKGKTLLRLRMEENYRCLLCRGLLIYPIVLPCDPRHRLCQYCFKNVEEKSNMRFLPPLLFRLIIFFSISLSNLKRASIFFFFSFRYILSFYNNVIVIHFSCPFCRKRLNSWMRQNKNNLVNEVNSVCNNLFIALKLANLI